MPKGTAKARIMQLRETLHRANRAYYVDAAPTIADSEYDALLRELIELEADHPELDDENSPSKRVGGEPIKGFATLPHPIPMLSIDNTYSDDEVRAWVKRVGKAMGSETEAAGGLFASDSDGVSATFMCDPKIDGVALSIRYEHGRFVRALTRGDGVAGDEVSHAARTIERLPLVLDTDHPPAVLEVRGEVFIPTAEFVRINAEREDAGQEPFMNPRNACAGTLKQLDPKAAASRKLGFVAHGRGEMDAGFASSHQEFLERIQALGVPIS